MLRNKRYTPVSVVMPVFNSAEYLPLAIESILNQTYTGFEFIIIDDGSKDTSWDIIRRYSRQDGRIKPLQNPSNLGICKTLNRGLTLARGEYVARMDADDWSYPERLGEQFSFMKSHSRVVVCGGDINVCDKDLAVINRRLYPCSDKTIREKMLRINPFAHPAIMYRKNIVMKVGGYNPLFAGVEDYDLYFRLGREGKFANLPQKMLKLRTHPDSISGRTITSQARLNLYIRIKAVVEYGYSASFFDEIYFCLNLIGIWLIPGFLQFRIYNFLRKLQK
jgi:glycosyltransferase involved in cell wall biosynthesis